LRFLFHLNDFPFSFRELFQRPHASAVLVLYFFVLNLNQPRLVNTENIEPSGAHARAHKGDADFPRLRVKLDSVVAHPAQLPGEFIGDEAAGVRIKNHSTAI
jgi:hypothetical protein